MRYSQVGPYSSQSSVLRRTSPGRGAGMDSNRRFSTTSLDYAAIVGKNRFGGLVVGVLVLRRC